MSGRRSFVVLSGGGGGAKLALGLAKILDPDRLTIIANTGDDFEHLGLHVSPDVDSLMYTLAGVINPETGWGRAGETWHFLDAVAELGGEDWFRIGDRDLAVHVERTRRLRGGATLSEVTQSLCRALGVQARIVPMSDEPVRTVVVTNEGELGFQDYFVRRRWQPRVSAFRYDGADEARPSPDVCTALEDPDLAGVIISPSNPFVSIDPILSVRGITERLRALRAPIVAVSPIVGDKAIRGALGKMLEELGTPPSAVAIARRYADRRLLTGFVLDRIDEHLRGDAARTGARVATAATVMSSLDDRIALARDVIAFATRCFEERGPRNA